MDILGFMVSGAIVYKNTEEYGRREGGQREGALPDERQREGQGVRDSEEDEIK